MVWRVFKTHETSAAPCCGHQALFPQRGVCGNESVKTCLRGQDCC